MKEDQSYPEFSSWYFYFAEYHCPLLIRILSKWRLRIFIQFPLHSYTFFSTAFHITRKRIYVIKWNLLSTTFPRVPRSFLANQENKCIALCQERVQKTHLPKTTTSFMITVSWCSNSLSDLSCYPIYFTLICSVSG